MGSGPKEKRVLPCWCCAANNKATEQEHKTDKHRHQSDVFAHYGKQTQTCHQLDKGKTGAAVCSNNVTFVDCVVSAWEDM